MSKKSCFWCGRQIFKRVSTAKGTLPDDSTKDHLLSRFIRKTTGEISNTVRSCRQCNTHRGYISNVYEIIKGDRWKKIGDDAKAQIVNKLLRKIKVQNFRKIITERVCENKSLCLAEIDDILAWRTAWRANETPLCGVTDNPTTQVPNDPRDYIPGEVSHHEQAVCPCPQGGQEVQHPHGGLEHADLALFGQEEGLPSD